MRLQKVWFADMVVNIGKETEFIVGAAYTAS